MHGLEAEKELCEMQSEIANRLGLKTSCTCSRSTEETDTREVPDEVIKEMWRRLTHSCWRTEGKGLTIRETMNMLGVKEAVECAITEALDAWMKRHTPKPLKACS